MEYVSNVTDSFNWSVQLSVPLSGHLLIGYDD